jgi:hypothetical protein
VTKRKIKPLPGPEATRAEIEAWEIDSGLRKRPVEIMPRIPAPPGDLDPPLPDRALCISLWEPYASLVVTGVDGRRKTLETRKWEWPYPPSWLVIHAAKHVDLGACKRLGLRTTGYPTGSLLGLVYVAGPSRPLIPEDEEEACFYEPGRFAWPLDPGRARPFARPVPIPRGPQKFVYLPRTDVLRHLRGGQ